MAGRILSLCFACCRSVPVVFISAIIVWSYYAYVFQMCLFAVDSYLEKIVYLILYHPALAMMAWSYWKTIFTSVAIPPKQFHLSGTALERLNNDLNQSERREVLQTAGRNVPAQCRTLTGEMRYCEKCKAIKPDRAHHCSICGKCVLKMDHHCPWVNNCVCFSNYKFFVLFLWYALVYCLYVAITSLQYFIHFWANVSNSSKSSLSSLHVVFLFFAALMFGISLMSLSGYHCYLISKNRTTLEAFQTPIFTSGPDKNGYNLGAYRNFIYVFGSNKKYWFLPMYTSYGDGLTYPMNSSNPDEAQNSLLGWHQRCAEEGEDEDDSDVRIFDRNSLRMP